MHSSSSSKIPFYIHIEYLFIALLVGFALISGWNQYQATSTLLKQSADHQFRLTAKTALERFIRDGESVTRELAAIGKPKTP